MGVRKSAKNASINGGPLGSARNNLSNRSSNKQNKHIAEAYKQELKKLKKMGSINYDIDDDDELER